MISSSRVLIGVWHRTSAGSRKSTNSFGVVRLFGRFMRGLSVCIPLPPSKVWEKTMVYTI